MGRGQGLRRTYRKLVRDRIPEIIESQGGSCQCRILAEDEYTRALKAKLVEEAQEALVADDREGLLRELADVMEVVDSLLKATGLSISALREEQRRRREERGGFERRLSLIWSQWPEEGS